MGKYIVKRILQVIPMLFILSLIVFMMVRLIPGDPVDMMLGMDIPKDTKVCCWASLRPSTAINSRITSSWFCRS